MVRYFSSFEGGILHCTVSLSIRGEDKWFRNLK